MDQFFAAVEQRVTPCLSPCDPSGSTLNEVLRTLRILNEDNDITIFSLIGRKDLMVESL
jgi:hypothetical protein